MYSVESLQQTWNNHVKSQILFLVNACVNDNLVLFVEKVSVVAMMDLDVQIVVLECLLMTWVNIQQFASNS